MMEPTEADLVCPKCGATMRLVDGAESENRLRICPECKLLAWEEGGVTETREGQRLTEEEIAELRLDE